MPSSLRVPHNSDLSQQVILRLLRSGQTATFRVLGRSMWPAIPSGSVVKITPCPDTAIAPGDVVAYERKGTVVVHRVLATDRNGLQCRGDCAQLTSEFLPWTSVLGKSRLIRRRRLNLRLPRRSEIASWLRTARLRWQLRRKSQGFAGRAQRNDN